MAIKEMPIEEKYNAILDMWILVNAMSYAYHKKQGTLEKWLDYTLEAYRGYMGPMFKMMEKISPGESFKQFASQLMYMQQMMERM